MAEKQLYVASRKHLNDAVTAEEQGNISEAVFSYHQGITLLHQAAETCVDPQKKIEYRKRANDYLTRAEELKEQLRQSKKQEAEPKEKLSTSKKQEEAGGGSLKDHVQIEIAAGATGYGYNTVFGPYLDDRLTAAAVRDPYIRSNAQMYNLQRFCEVLIEGAPNLKKVFLLTSQDAHKQREVQQQVEGLNDIKSVLASRNIEFIYTFKETLHDREIRFNNDWIVKIGRGLDYFDRLDGRFAIGSGNYNLRKCRRTTIDIFRKSSVVEM